VPGSWRHSLIALTLVAASSCALAQDVGGGACGNLRNGYGPFDFRTQKRQLGVVEAYHFTPEVETLKEGKSGRIGGDIDYTLRAFPNHHRALMAMMKLGARDKTNRPLGANFTVECYMLRAETFRPEDGMVKTIYGLYLMRNGRTRDAMAKLDAASKLNEVDSNVLYNLGLAYFDLGDYDKALDNARRAYAAGFPLPGLRDKLKRVGKWREQGALATGTSPSGSTAPEPPVSANEAGSESDTPVSTPTEGR
jgi:tetratricopeptide (TPR) repeat protein